MNHACISNQILILLSFWRLLNSCNVDVKILDVFGEEVSIIRPNGVFWITSKDTNNPLTKVQIQNGGQVVRSFAADGSFNISVDSDVFRDNLGNNLIVTCLDKTDFTVPLPTYTPCSVSECAHRCYNRSACIITKQDLEKDTDTCKPQCTKYNKAVEYFCLTDTQGDVTEETTDTECDAMLRGRNVWAIVKSKSSCAKVKNTMFPLQLATSKNQEYNVNQSLFAGQTYVIHHGNVWLNAFQKHLCQNGMRCELYPYTNNHSFVVPLYTSVGSGGDKCAQDGLLYNLTGMRIKDQAPFSINKIKCEIAHQDATSLGSIYFYLYLIDPYFGLPVTCVTTHDGHGAPICRWDVLPWTYQQSHPAHLIRDQFYACSTVLNMCNPERLSLRSNTKRNVEICHRSKHVVTELVQIGNILEPDLSIGHVTQVYVGSLGIELVVSVFVLISTWVIKRKMRKQPTDLEWLMEHKNKENENKMRRHLHPIDINAYDVPTRVNIYHTYIRKDAWKAALQQTSETHIKRCESVTAFKANKVHDHLKELPIENEDEVLGSGSHILGRQCLIRERCKGIDYSLHGENVIDIRYGNLLLGVPWAGYHTNNHTPAC